MNTSASPLSPAVQVEYDYLWSLWDAAQRRADQLPGPLHRVWDALTAEGAAWASLVEYVDAHGLAGTSWDPRTLGGGDAA